MARLISECFRKVQGLQLWSLETFIRTIFLFANLFFIHIECIISAVLLRCIDFVSVYTCLHVYGRFSFLNIVAYWVRWRTSDSLISTTLWSFQVLFVIHEWDCTPLEVLFPVSWMYSSSVILPFEITDCSVVFTVAWNTLSFTNNMLV